ncbi:hypothetical protein [Blastomonas sp. SL216]|uniref:hypothetical protein n=1 Tax=Blastomonas sp. SL216 TaxID=2995169 RepID=UPI002377B36F|nr:hypothetical protein OU999_08625 [Blastomonas sp. SL216]
MMGVLASAALLTVLALNPYFAALTLSATLGVFSGIRVLRRKRPDREATDRATALDWAVTVTLLALSFALLTYTAAGGVQHRQPFIYALTGATILYAGYDVLRFLRPAEWPFFPRLWLYEHMVKMLGAFAAVLSAFSGSVLTFIPIPDPWKQLWPTILFYLITIMMIARNARRPVMPVQGSE